MSNAAELAQAVVRSFREPPPPAGIADPDTNKDSAGARGRADGPGSADTPAAGPAAIAPAVPVPAGALPEPADLATTLRRRRAIRTFAPVPVTPEVLFASVAAGMDTDRRYWPDEQGCCPLEPVLVAQRVAGLAPAIYGIDLAARSATAVFALAGPGAYEELTLQREFAGAGAVVAVLADVDAAARRHGGHGYRLLMTRAGAAVYAMWLDAVARGLVGSVFAGFLPAAIRTPLRCDGVSRHQLFAVAVGNPPEEALSPPRGRAAGAARVPRPDQGPTGQAEGRET